MSRNLFIFLHILHIGIALLVSSAAINKALAEPANEAVYLPYEEIPLPDSDRPRSGIKTVKKGIEAYYDHKKYKFSSEWKQNSIDPRGGTMWIRLKFRF